MEDEKEEVGSGVKKEKDVERGRKSGRRKRRK